VLDVRNLYLFAGAILLLGLGSPGPARAQGYPPDQLLGGEVRLAVGAVQFGGSCYVNRGNSQFQRNGPGPKAVISFDEIVDNAIWELRGQAVLTFATATSGIIRFKQVPALPAAVSSPPFLNYTQTYDAVSQRLVVTFSIVFPDCTLPVLAVFDPA
jgi:hypothetical protein